MKLGKLDEWAKRLERIKKNKKTKVSPLVGYCPYFCPHFFGQSGGGQKSMVSHV